ncbi:MAG: hypothetical protein IKL84_04980, partial [Clostridia bacterium]|nr:hypothetical protein [Clostridia bacterium]
MNRRPIETLKTVLVFVLFVSMLLLALIYVLEIRQSRLKGQDIPFDKMWIFRNEENSLADSMAREGLVMPEFIGFRNSMGRRAGVSTDSEVIRSLYRQVATNISRYFGNGYRSESLGEEEGARRWHEATAASRFIYIKYHSELPSALIHMFATESTLASPGAIADGAVVYLSELFLTMDDRGVTTVLTKGSGGYAEFTPVSPDKELFFDLSLLDAYTGSRNLVPFSFYADSEAYRENGHVSGTVRLQKKQPEAYRLLIETDYAASLTAGSETNANLLRLFGFNPELVSQYSEPNGSTVYVSTEARMEMTAEGKLTYIANGDGGIAFESLFHYGPGSGEYDLYESIKSVVSLAESLYGSRYTLWNNGYLLITGIRTDDGGAVTLDLDLFCENTLLYFGEHRHAATFTFRDGRILYAALEAFSFSFSEDKERILTSEW